MRNSLADVVAAALRVLDAQGLENCSMRRVAAELDVQPSALYHHVPNKQSLLALMADEIVLGVGPRTTGPGAAALPAAVESGADPALAPARAPISETVPAARRLCIDLREAMLAVRDGADVVATAAAFRLGRSRVEEALAGFVGSDGARTLLLFTFGHAQSTQTHRQAAALGALVVPAVAGEAVPDPVSADPERDHDASFERGLDLILAGLLARESAELAPR